MSEWIGWNGGECPVHPNTVVEAARHCSDIRRCEAWKLQDSNWIDAGEEYSIIAYRVIEEYKEPREFWIAVNPHGGVDCVLLNDEKLIDGWTKIHVREVLDENS